MRRKGILFLMSAVLCAALCVPYLSAGAESGFWSKNAVTGVVTCENSTEMFFGNQAGGFYTEAAKVSGDYTVSTTMKGSQPAAVGSRMDAGILAWYYDQNNWVSLSLSWWVHGHTTVIDILSVVCTNGVTAYTDRYFDNGTWSALPAYSYTADQAISLKVTKTYNAENAYDVYSYYIDDVKVTDQNIGLSATPQYRSKEASAGYVCYAVDATFTFTELSISVPGPAGDPVSYTQITGAGEGVTGCAADGEEWTYSAAAGYSIEAKSGAVYNHIFVPNPYSELNYRFSLTAALDGAAIGSEVLISSWYVNSNNNVLFFVRKTDTGWTAVMQGKIGGIAITGGQKTITVSGDIEITASKVGTSVFFYLGEEEILKYQNAAMDTGSKGLFGAGNVKAVFSNVEFVEEQYEAYDFYRVTIGEALYKISAKDMESVNISGSTIEILSKADNYTRVITSSQSSGTVSVSMTFTDVGEEAGMYIYYIDEDNNVAVTVTSDKMVLSYIINGVSGSKNFTVAPDLSSFTLDVELYGNKVSAELDGESVFSAEEIAGINISESVDIGVLAKGGACSVNIDEIIRFTPFADRIEGDYIFRGDSFATWSLEDGKVKGSVVNGTTWNQTLAFRSIGKDPAQDYYVGASIKVTEKKGTEWKAGLLPFYQDGGNFVYVWISQWANGGVTILMNCFMDGQICGETWRETAVTCDISEVNYLEIRVSGDNVYVYLNKSYSPTAATVFTGLGAKTGNNFMGMNIYNVSAEFGEITVSDARIFKNTTPPTIDYVGTIPVTGTVGTEIRLPTFVAQSASPDGSASIDVKITLNGTAVESAKGKFTPSEAGKYIVTVTATDEWGNPASQTYEITVAAANDGNGGDTGGCSKDAAAQLPLLAILAAFAFFRKRS